MGRPGRLEGRTVIVTGAGSGLGRGTALRFAAEGARLVLADLDGDAAATTADQLGDASDRLAITVDVADQASTEAMAAATIARFGSIDGLVHCAGIAGKRGTAVECERDSWEQVLNVNLTGSWLAAKAVLPAMVESGRGSIVFVGSVAGLVGIPELPAYAASKGGVVALTRQMAVDFAADGVRVNSICPGSVPTALASVADPAAEAERRRSLEERHPMRRLGTVDDIANLALYLISDESGWVTGDAIAIDGGLVAAGWPRPESG